MNKDPVVVFMPTPEEDSADPFALHRSEGSKHVGDFVAQGEEVCEMELQKCCVMIASPVSGVVTDVFFEIGEEVRFGSPLYEVTPADTGAEARAVALKIFANRFPDSATQFEEIVSRVTQQKILSCMQIIANGTQQDVILQLSSEP